MTFQEIIKGIASGFALFSIGDALDILIIAAIVYKLISWTRETRAYQVLKGFGVLVLCYFASQLLQLQTVSWLLGSVVQSGIIVFVMLFQPELRRAFEHLGRGKVFDKNLWITPVTTGGTVSREMHHAIMNMSRRRVGALLVMEQSVALGDIIGTGTRIDGVISSALIENIFEPNTPLHDGAVIIRGESIVAAGCFLPLSDDVNLARELGTRHRAALGISTVSDSITIVVSEETGTISFARDGKLMRYVDSKALTDLLESVFNTDRSGTSLFKRRARA